MINGVEQENTLDYGGQRISGASYQQQIGGGQQQQRQQQQYGGYNAYNPPF
jgi:hypothetical protein